MLLTLVTCDEHLIKKRLEKRKQEEDHLVSYGTYRSFKKMFEAFDQIDYTFVNQGNFEENMQQYTEFLKTRLQKIPPK